MYAPTSMEDFDISKLGQAPSEKLQLEWVYPWFWHKMKHMKIIKIRMKWLISNKNQVLLATLL